MNNAKSNRRNRFVVYGALALLGIGGLVGYQLYQMRQANLRAAEGFYKNAEMLERMRER